MRAGFGRAFVAATSILFIGAVTGAPAAIVREAPGGASPKPAPSRIDVQADPALSTGEVAMPQVPHRSKLTPAGARGAHLTQPPHLDGTPPTHDGDAVIRQPVVRPLDGAIAPQAIEVPVIPEPSTGVLLLTVGVAALARRGRRRSRQ